MYDLAYPKNSIELLWDELESNIKKTTTEQDMAKSIYNAFEVTICKT